MSSKLIKNGSRLTCAGAKVASTTLFKNQNVNDKKTMTLEMNFTSSTVIPGSGSALMVGADCGARGCEGVLFCFLRVMFARLYSSTVSCVNSHARCVRMTSVTNLSIFSYPINVMAPSASSKQYPCDGSSCAARSRKNTRLFTKRPKSSCTSPNFG